MKAVALRAQIESVLAGRLYAPFTFREGYEPETVSTGVPEIDALTGGAPRGGLTEICGPDSSGRTSLLLSLLAEITGREEVGAWVDASDAFHPHSAAAAGVDLDRLLWVRCRHIEQALRAAGLLVQGGGFGVVAVDLGDIPAETARRVPLASWFRLRRAVEDTPTLLIVLEQRPYAKTCASLVLRLAPDTAQWSTVTDLRNSELETRNSVRNSTFENRKSPCLSHTRLLRGAQLAVEVIRCRTRRESRNSKFEIRLPVGEFRVSNFKFRTGVSK